MTHPDQVEGRRIVDVRTLEGGRSNPTRLLVADDGSRYVLRTRPPGETDPTAHRIDREVRVLRALAEQRAIPVPRVVAWQPSPPAGEPYYVMTFVPGAVPEDPALPDVDPLHRRRLWENAVDALAGLHAIDPESIGLADYGPTGDFNVRQIERWQRRNAEDETPPALAALGRALSAAPPPPHRRTLVHGDYRLGNWIVDPADGTLAAVVDWELSTLGDPLSDLAYLLLSYAFPRHGSVLPGLAGEALPAGTPSPEDLIVRYAAATGDVPPGAWARHRALALFRSASIALGVFRRRAARDGARPSRTELAMVESLASLGLDLLPPSIRSLP